LTSGGRDVDRPPSPLALTATSLGAVGTTAYVPYVGTTSVVSGLIARVGQRATVVAGRLRDVIQDTQGS
jgi:hypothetical protein